MKGMNSIDKSVRWGDYFRIGEFNVIDKNVKIGSRVRIHHHVVLEEYTEIGSDSIISPFVYIQKGTKIGRNAVLGMGYRSGGDGEVIGYNFEASCKSTTGPGTRIGNNVFLGPHAIILHKKVGGEHISCIIGDDVFIGANATILPGMVIGPGAIIGAGAVVAHDVSDGITVVGVPAIEVIKGGFYSEPVTITSEDDLIPAIPDSQTEES